MQISAPPGSYHAVLHCGLHVLSHSCFLLVVKPVPCVAAPAHMGHWHGWWQGLPCYPMWSFLGLPALRCAVGVPQASSFSTWGGPFGIATSDLALHWQWQKPCLQAEGCLCEGCTLAALLESCFWGYFGLLLVALCAH